MSKLQNISLTLILSHDPNRVDKFNQRLFNICTEPVIPMDTTSGYSTTIGASQLIKMQKKKIKRRRTRLLVSPNCTNQSQETQENRLMLYLGCNILKAITQMQYLRCNIFDAISWMQYLGCNISGAISRMHFLGCNISGAISQMQYLGCDISN